MIICFAVVLARNVSRSQRGLTHPGAQISGLLGQLILPIRLHNNSNFNIFHILVKIVERTIGQIFPSYQGEDDDDDDDDGNEDQAGGAKAAKKKKKGGKGKKKK